MIRKSPNHILMVMLVLLAGCSSVASEGSPTASPPVSAKATSTPVQSATSPLTTRTDTPEISPSPPPADKDDNLAGTLYFIGYEGNVPAIFALELATGGERLVFKAPENAWLSEVAVSPGGDKLLLAYSPPPTEGQVQYGFTDLYQMPADGTSGPELLLQDEDDSDTYFNISWPLADTIYYAHFLPTIDADGNITYGSQVERYQLSTASTELIAAAAAWPRASDDGASLAYVTDANDLILANGDGSEPRTLLEPGTFTAVDAPVFSPDNSLLCFSAVNAEQVSAPSIISRVLGVRIANAHSVPSDWWCMNLESDAELKRLTDLEAIGFYGDFSPSGDHLAFMTIAGLYLIQADGSDLRQLRQGPLTGTVNWAP